MARTPDVKLRRSILGNPSMGSIAASLFSQAMLLLSGPASARLMGVTGRGEYALLAIIATFGGFFGAAGLPTAIAYALARERVPASYVLKIVAGTWLRLSLGAGLLSALAVLVIFRGPTSSPRWLEAGLVAASVMSSMTAQLILACIQGEHHFRALNLLRPLVITLSAVSLVILWLALRHAGPAVALGVNGAANTAACVVGAAFLFSRPHRETAGARISTQSLLRYGLASLTGANAPLETLQIDQAVVGLLLSRYDLGLYAVGSAFDNLPGIFVSGVGMIALPRVAGAPNREARNAIMRRAILVSVGLAGAATAFAEAIVGWVLPVAFGSSFSGAIPAARVLILAGFFMGSRRIFVVFLQGLGRPGPTGVGELLALVTLLGLAAILVPLFSLVGASLALLGAAVVANVFLIQVLARAVT